MTTHRNHYVPQWHQRRFLPDSKARLFYLDLTPERTTLLSGESVGPPAMQRNSPRMCFWSQDLYTTAFGDIQNDDIERYLFGKIDDDGAHAVRAVLSGEMDRLHEYFQRFFEYLDAQKLRTPKGLAWIRTKYPRLDQQELMLEMQHLRQMHCTMWMEAVREIVSAEASDVKFILTDHPVTVYHQDCPPESSLCGFPHDPDIALKGSQTLFPMGPDHCLILTNLEYAQEPGRTDLLQPRQNARSFGHTLTRIDSWIRSRKLAAPDVTAINHILKSRAHRFIAAREESWLYPEKVVADNWKTNGKVLLPPEDGLWHFGGEIYVGYKDGRTGYQDAYGRTSRSYEFLRKDPPSTEPVADDLCSCGSGRTFSTCCRDIAPEDRMPSNVFSIRERNLMFLHSTERVLGLDSGKSWEDVRRELSDDQVKRIHETYAALWPKDTNLAELLPRPDPSVARALYVGLIDPRTIGASVVGWLQYIDEVLVINPFLNAAYIRPKYSPIETPGQFKEQTIKNVALLSALAPYIHAGIVHVIPDPLEFNDTFREMVWGTAKERVGNTQPTNEDREVAMALARDDLKRSFARLPDSALRHQILKHTPDMPSEKVEEMIAYIRKEQNQDQFALLQTSEPGEAGAQLQQFRSTNFELAFFLAQLTGAAIYTDQRSTALDLEAAINATPTGREGCEGERTAIERCMPLRINLDNSAVETLKTRDSASSQEARSALRELLNMRTGEGDPAGHGTITDAVAKLERAVAAIATETPAEQPDLANNLVFDIDTLLAVPLAGYGLNAAQRFLVTFGRRKHVGAVPLSWLFGRAAKPTHGPDSEAPGADQADN